MNWKIRKEKKNNKYKSIIFITEWNLQIRENNSPSRISPSNSQNESFLFFPISLIVFPLTNFPDYLLHFILPFYLNTPLHLNLDHVYQPVQTKDYTYGKIGTPTEPRYCKLQLLLESIVVAIL
jgi:hypothetical protein